MKGHEIVKELDGMRDWNSLESNINPAQRLERLTKMFEKFPNKRVRLNFNGNCKETFGQYNGFREEKVPIHRIKHRIISLDNAEGKSSGLYLCDTQEDCQEFKNYCGEHDSFISLNEFDELINPQTLERFNPSEAYDYLTITKSLGKETPGSIYISDEGIHCPCTNTGFLTLHAFEKGKIESEKTRLTSCYLGNYAQARKDYHHNQKQDIPFDLMRNFIEKIRGSYKSQ